MASDVPAVSVAMSRLAACIGAVVARRTAISVATAIERVSLISCLLCWDAKSTGKLAHNSFGGGRRRTHARGLSRVAPDCRGLPASRAARPDAPGDGAGSRGLSQAGGRRVAVAGRATL